VSSEILANHELKNLIEIIMKTSYILNPDYTLKHDSNRVILYSKRHIKNGGANGWVSYLHPLQAMIFSLFKEEKSLNENLSLISKMTRMSEAKIHSFLKPFMENNESLKATWNGEDIAFPKKMLIEAKNAIRSKKDNDLSIDKLLNHKRVDIQTKRLQTFPLIFTFMLNNRCVTKCKYCYADTKTKVKEELSTERIKDLLKEAYELGVQNVNLIGGEIFLHKDWDIILEELIKYGYEPDILSTKFPLTKKMIERIEEIGFKNPIQVSLDSLQDDVLENLICVKKGYADKIKKTLKMLDESSLNYQISTVLTKYNASEESLLSIHNFILDLKKLSNWDLRLAMDSLYQDANSLKLSREQALNVHSVVTEQIKPNCNTIVDMDVSLAEKEFFVAKEGSSSFEGAKCSALNNHMFILPDGQVTICEQLYWNPNFIIGNVTQDSIQDVWNSDRVKQLLSLKQNDIQKRSACKSCSKFTTCFSESNRCWADIIKAYGGSKWDFPDPRCNKAPKMMQNNLAYV
jgi:radical SAM protein with 4Fe4S-binding SPASM domain